jgi:hypothetical protein
MFKQCGKCKKKWENREEFLDDKDLKLIGYQVHFEDLELGIILFNHACNSTLGIYAKEFTDLYDGPVFAERATGSEDCSGYCLDQSNLMPCAVKCECAYVREILKIINNWKQ